MANKARTPRTHEEIARAKAANEAYMKTKGVSPGPTAPAVNQGAGYSMSAAEVARRRAGGPVMWGVQQVGPDRVEKNAGDTYTAYDSRQRKAGMSPEQLGRDAFVAQEAHGDNASDFRQNELETFGRALSPDSTPAEIGEAYSGGTLKMIPGSGFVLGGGQQQSGPVAAPWAAPAAPALNAAPSVVSPAASFSPGPLAESLPANVTGIPAVPRGQIAIQPQERLPSGGLNYMQGMRQGAGSRLDVLQSTSETPLLNPALQTVADGVKRAKSFDVKNWARNPWRPLPEMARGIKRGAKKALNKLPWWVTQWTPPEGR